MSLASPHTIGCNCPRLAARPAPRFSPAGLDDQAGRSRRRGRLRPAGRIPLDVRHRSRCGTRPPGPPAALRFGLGGRGLMPLAFYRWVWRQPPARATGAAARPQAAPDRRPVAGRHRAGAQTIPSRPGRGRCARRRSSRWPTTPAGATFGRGAQPAAPALGLAGRHVPAVARSALLAIFPAAATNAWRRLLAPWKNTPRYTFAAVEPCQAQLVVAHGEPFSLAARLAEQDRLAAARGRGADRRAACRSRRRCATDHTSSSCRRRSIPAGSKSRSATPSSASGSSRRCVPS